jgi:hypothetical protein
MKTRPLLLLTFVSLSFVGCAQASLHPSHVDSQDTTPYNDHAQPDNVQRATIVARTTRPIIVVAVGQMGWLDTVCHGGVVFSRDGFQGTIGANERVRVIPLNPASPLPPGSPVSILKGYETIVVTDDGSEGGTCDTDALVAIDPATKAQ